LLTISQEGSISLEKGFVDYFKTEKPETLSNLVTPSKARPKDEQEDEEPLPKILPILLKQENTGTLFISRNEENLLKISSFQNSNLKSSSMKDEFSTLNLIVRIESIHSKKMKTFEKMKISHFSSGKLVGGKDVIVVLFSNWKISCFDKELNLIWNNDFLSSIKMSEPK
jgi:hypothetical protein